MEAASSGIPIQPLERCTVCGADETRPAPLGLVACAACGTVRATEFAAPEHLYVEGYYAGGGGSFGLDVHHPRFQRYLLEVGAQRVRWLSRHGARSRGAMLDVGAGTGEFLAAARDAGWTVAGAEPIEDSAAAARARGLDVRTATLAGAGFERGDWDVVSALHVLEHLKDPVAFLREVAGWARPGGLVMVEVPNWDSTLRRITGEHWMHLRPLEHLTHFTPHAMEQAFERAGLDPVAVRTPTFRSREHTLAEAAEVAGRPTWEAALARVSPTRDGVRVPGPLARAAFTYAESRDERRGRGMVVRALARVPA